MSNSNNKPLTGMQVSNSIPTKERNGDNSQFLEYIVVESHPEGKQSGLLLIGVGEAEYAIKIADLERAIRNIKEG